MFLDALPLVKTNQILISWHDHLEFEFFKLQKQLLWTNTIPALFLYSSNTEIFFNQKWVEKGMPIVIDKRLSWTNKVIAY